MQQSAPPWAEPWTRVEAKVWAEDEAEAAVARAKAVQAEAKVPEELEAARFEEAVEREALALAGVWIWARKRARVQTGGLPSALAHLSTIWRILSSQITRDLWHHSPEAREDYWCIIDFIAPITRLPFELLRQIFLIIIDGASGLPLLLVCKQWNAVVTSIWASLNLGTGTPIEAVTRKLERNQWLLDIRVDTDSDRGDFIPSDDAFDAIFAAIQASSRWRSLIVESFPAHADLPEDLVARRLQLCSNNPMSRFTTFKIKSACGTSPLLNGLLRILGTTARGLGTVEINSANVIAFLAPTYSSMFHFVKTLSLDTPGIPNPVDLLPHLHQLETFTASHISFPVYHDDVDLPFVHTLRHLRLKAASIQWMNGRTFHVLEDCTLLFTLHHPVLHTFTTTLPSCKQSTFQGYHDD